MKTIRVTDDQSMPATSFSVRMECDCGWLEKCYDVLYRGKAIKHLTYAHSGGVILYKNNAEEV